MEESSSSSSRLSPPLRLTVQLILTIALLWVLNYYLVQFFYVSGGLPAFIILGSLLTLMNLLVRPVLAVILFPFKLFMGIIAIIAANAGFLWLLLRIADRMDPAVVQLQIGGGVWGWIVVAVILGSAHWVMKHVLR